MLQTYKLQLKMHNDKTPMRIDEGMHGLKEAGALAYDELRRHLGQYGHHPIIHAPGFWKHNTNKMIFTLVVDDFGVKCLTKESDVHLINAFQDKHGDLEINWNGENFVA